MLCHAKSEYVCLWHVGMQCSVGSNTGIQGTEGSAGKNAGGGSGHGGEGGSSVCA